MRRYRGLIYRVVKSYMGSLTDAEDMFQDIYLFLYQNQEDTKSARQNFPHGSIGLWLIVVWTYLKVFQIKSVPYRII